ncbi:MAG: bifunctional diaminohydroxyphosphoribosylaminopyrimidine deaminase/5-amino-6-(5-phosphoribosylamino)uracil reductase RibD [Bacteriovoracaceae bacterium]
MDFDRRYIQRTFELAKKANHNAQPNPYVGAVITKDDHVISEGYHKIRGGLHAEADAISKVDPGLLDGATIYINLEPCCHEDKLTPPCAQAIIRHGIKRVVISNRDPNPKVSGQGIELLRKHNIEVVEGVLETEGAWLNRIFFKNQKEKKPYISLKCAITLDGKIATATGDSKWITGLEARKFSHKLRANHKAIAIGSGTLKSDNPSLDARLEDFYGDQATVLLFSSSEVSKEFKVFDSSINRKVEVVKSQNNASKEQLEETLDNYFKQGISSIFVEGGSELLSSFLRYKLFDELHLFMAPKVLGSGKSFANLGEASSISEGLELELRETQKLGNDLYMNYLRKK